MQGQKVDKSMRDTEDALKKNECASIGGDSFPQFKVGPWHHFQATQWCKPNPIPPQLSIGISVSP